jgi:hypothetical protein
MASDSHPVDPAIILANLQHKFPAHIPGFTVLAADLRERATRTAFFKDEQAIPKKNRLLSHVQCGRMHPGLCVSKD